MRSLLTILSLFITFTILGEAGVIVPRGHSFPNKNYLVTDNMRVDIEIVNQYANVKIMQIFHNKKDYALEGEYIFTMPDNAMISNFAIWEDGERIKGVIMEKKKARALYEKIKARMIDPGLFEKKGDETINKFSVNIFPIPANGYKRIEIQYTELLPVQFLKTHYILPLKPLLYKKYKNEIKDFTLNLNYRSEIPFNKVDFVSPFPINFDKPSEYFKKIEKTDKTITLSYNEKRVVLDKDFTATLNYDVKDNIFSLLTYRDVDKVRIDYSPDNNGKKYQDKTGFFMGQLLLFNPQKTEKANQDPKEVLLVFDHSLSMKWLKLVMAYDLFEKSLETLSAKDTFNVLIWNSETKTVFEKSVLATPENIKKAKQTISKLLVLSGTDIEKLGDKLKDQNPGTLVYWITDGQPTIGEIDDKKLEKIFSSKLGHLKFFILGVGSDVNKKFLSKIAQKTQGYYLHFYETEDSKAKMELFQNAIEQKPIKGFKYSLKKGENFEDVYELNNVNALYDRSLFTLVGKYKKPKKSDFSISFKSGKESVKKSYNLDLPEKSTKYIFIKRVWAKARIEFLLRQIDQHGEKKEWISEIIALSKEFTLVTPYTSFLAAPRSLIRPRSIIPGDPVLRVKADKNIISITAKFKFGMVKKLQYIPEKKRWEVRFLVPSHLKDGEYGVKLFLVDTKGQTYIENKSLRIDSTPPKMGVKYKIDKNRLKIVANASSDTRRIIGYINDKLFRVKYSSLEGSSIGFIDLKYIKPGDSIKFLLEDFAHNTTTIYDVVNF